MLQLPENFWENGWGDRPAVIKASVAPLLELRDEICAGIADDIERISLEEGRVTPGGVLLNVDGIKHGLRDLTSALQSSGGDLVSTLEHLFRQNYWNLMAFGRQRNNRSLWQMAAEIRNQIDKNAKNLPTGRTDVDCFIGRYMHTAAGVHTDFAHNFAFTLEGEKVMHVMSPEKYFSENYSLEDYFDASEKLVYRVDELCYFPHDYYHCASTPDTVSFNVNISVWDSAFINETNNSDHVMGAYNLFVRELTKAVVEDPYLVYRVPDFIADQLGQHLVLRALMQVSSFGLETPLPPSEPGRCKFGKNRVIMAFIGDECVLSINGYVLRLSRLNFDFSKDLKDLVHDTAPFAKYLCLD